MHYLIYYKLSEWITLINLQSLMMLSVECLCGLFHITCWFQVECRLELEAQRISLSQIHVAQLELLQEETEACTHSLELRLQQKSQGEPGEEIHLSNRWLVCFVNFNVNLNY